MNSLSPKARQHLKAKAHKLKPVVMIGGKGLTDAVKKEVDIALNAHELIKIRIAIQDRDERKAILAEISESCNAHIVQSIGNIGVLYRKNED
jgi:RNA-binding protein